MRGEPPISPLQRGKGERNKRGAGRIDNNNLPFPLDSPLEIIPGVTRERVGGRRETQAVRGFRHRGIPGLNKVVPSHPGDVAT